MIVKIKFFLVIIQFLLLALQIISQRLLGKHKQDKLKIKLTEQDVKVFGFLSWFPAIPIIGIMIIVLIL